MLAVPERTYAVAARVHAVRPLLAPGDERKIASALGAFSAGVDPLELDERMALERPAANDAGDVRVRADRAREGEPRSTSCCPRATTIACCAAADILLRRGVVELTILGDPERGRRRAPRRSAWTSAARSSWIR